MTRCADAMARGSDLNDVSDMFYLEALQKCVSALRTAEHDAEGSGTKSAVADALAVSAMLASMLASIALAWCPDLSWDHQHCCHALSSLSCSQHLHIHPTWASRSVCVRYVQHSWELMGLEPSLLPPLPWQ